MSGQTGSSTANIGNYNVDYGKNFTLNTAVDVSQNASATLNGSGDHTVNNIQENQNYVVNFVTKTYTVTVSTGANGIVRYGGDTLADPEAVTVEYGTDNVAFRILPQDGYEIGTITAPGSTFDGEYVRFDNVTQNRTLHVTFDEVIVQYTVTVNWGSGGRVTYGGSTSPSSITVNAGDNLELFADPNDSSGYEINTITAPTANINNSSGRIYFSNIQADKTVNVTFSLRSYTVRVERTGNISTPSLPPGSSDATVIVRVNGTEIPHDGYRNFTVQHGEKLTINTTLSRYVRTGTDGALYEVYGK